jgi:DNA-binding NarL/FixJ family response regulator
VSSVLVFDYGTPRVRLLAWFLSDSGIPSVRVDALEDAAWALGGRPRVVIVNSTAPAKELAGLTLHIRERAQGARIVVIHDGKHSESDLPVEADLCVHDANDPDALVEVVRAALADDIPDTPDPHEAAEIIEEEERGGS